MTALAIVAALAIAGLVLIALRSQLAPGPRLTGRTVTINTTDDQSIRGILVGEHADRLTLTEAVYLYSSGDQHIPGLIHIPRERVSIIQEITPQS